MYKPIRFCTPLALDRAHAGALFDLSQHHSLMLMDNKTHNSRRHTRARIPSNLSIIVHMRCETRVARARATQPWCGLARSLHAQWQLALCRTR